MTAPVQTAIQSITGNLQTHSPPVGTPITDPAWSRWLTEIVWPIVGAGVNNSGPQVTTPQLQVGKAQFTTQNAFQALLNLNQGLYVTYSSGINNIIYGFACNVHRSSGTAFVVGAQINAWGEAGSSGDVFGVASTAFAQPFSVTRNLICEEPNVVNMASANLGAKWGVNLVFKDRMDGATVPGEGVIGSNFYNYYSKAICLTSQSRTASGEFCGWSVGIDFLDASLDIEQAISWNNGVTYPQGAVVANGGQLWKAIVTNNSVVPAAGATWVLRNPYVVTDFAVGIDFSSMSTTQMARMWSAIRLRNMMAIHWEESGVVATFNDAVNSRLVLCANYNGAFYVRQLQVDVTNGNLWVNNGITGLGGGAAPTLGTIGGSGPTVAAQRGWYKIIDGTTGNPFWVPVWQ